MFYQYNGLVGKLVGSQQFQPYFPLGVQSATSVEAPKITFADPHTVIAKESPRPRLGAGGKVYGSLSEKMRQQQMFFQKADGLPVHLKGGPMDRILFGLTIALCGVGLVQCFMVYYELSVPKKNQ